MRQPPFLIPGDKIGIIAPARKVSREELRPGLEILSGWGFQCIEGRHLYGEYHQFSGTDEERASDFQDMINNPEIRAIVTARGGYGCLRIVDRLDFRPMLEQPKWFCGYSDMTVIHGYLHNQGIQSLHSIMAFNMMPERFQKDAVESFGRALSGVEVHYEFAADPALQQFTRKGTASGQVIGGNLSILYAISGSNCEMDTEGKILFLEDLDEYLYHIDRMLLQLKRSGKLDKLAGLVIGGMTDMRDNATPFGFTAEEIIYNAVKEYDYPVAFGFPAGHQKDNRTLIFGKNAILETGERNILRYG